MHPANAVTIFVFVQELPIYCNILPLVIFMIETSFKLAKCVNMGGVFHIAFVPEIAVRTCPVVGAVEDDIFILDVALRSELAVIFLVASVNVLFVNVDVDVVVTAVVIV